MPEPRRRSLAIVGGGPAGLTAAIYAVRSGIDAELIEQAMPGGQVFIADRIENYPGFPEAIAGSELAERMRAQAERLGAIITIDAVDRIELEGERKRLFLQSGAELEAAALIVAPGSRPHELGVPGEKKYWGRGVSYCATCDGNFFRGQRVAVVGGGDSACQEATMLAHLAKEVHVIHRRDRFRAQEYLAQGVVSAPNVRTLLDTVVEAIVGDDEVRGLELKNVKTGERSRLPVEGVFVYVGVYPRTELLQGRCDLDDKGYVKAGEDCRTSVAGIMVAGDARTKPFMQIATAVADGANAVRSVEVYLIERGLSSKYF